MADKTNEERAKEEARQADLNSRIKAFNAELIPLLGKYKLALGAEPQYARTPDGYYVTVARPSVLDDSLKPNPPETEKKEDDVVKVD